MTKPTLSSFVTTFVPAPTANKTAIKGRKEDDDRSMALYVKKKTLAVMILTLFNAGLFIVDHIHFQYNGMMMGILIFSIAAIHDEKPLLGAFFFACLLQFKHIFLYIAPVYGIYLLRSYCFKPGVWVSPSSIQLGNIIKLGVIVILVFVVSIGPFALMGQIPQLLARLFPFKRGLVHAYWAPNFWALYLFADLVLAKVLGIPRPDGQTAMSGIVGAGSCSVLPGISPMTTLLLTLFSMIPVLVRVWGSPTKKFFTAALVQISLCSFMFGWHVHEKAILMVILPLGLMAADSVHLSKWFLRFAFVGHYSLMPLLFEPAEAYVRGGLVLAHWSATFVLLQAVHAMKDPEIEQTGFGFSLTDKIGACGFAVLYLLTDYVIPENFPHLQFLPLMLTSVYCAALHTYLWVTYTAELIRSR